MNRFKRKSAQITRWMLCILLLSAIIVGCGEDPYPPDITMIDNGQWSEWWQIFCIAGEGSENNIRYPRDKVIFSHTGSFIHEARFYETEKYTSVPEVFISADITYTTRGHYTTRGTLLTITDQNTQVNVDVRLEPEAAGQQQIEGMRLAEFESVKAAEIKKGLQQNKPPLFKANTEYTWQIEDNYYLLILSRPEQVIVLYRQSFLDELVLD